MSITFVTDSDPPEAFRHVAELRGTQIVTLDDHRLSDVSSL